MNWVIIVVFVGLIILFIKMKAARHKFVMITLLIILLFVYVTYSRVASANSIKIDQPGDILKAGKVYLGWLGNAIGNLKLVTSNVAKMEWQLENKTTAEENED